ncbi:MAG: glycosyltransferase [Rikenellaceae bacterium]|nr:glycosyltransferase [Rikenellaceae bacterium]
MNKTSEYDFTIVVPLYNEVDNMERLEVELSRYISSASLAACVLFVNDGSTDGSLECVRAICDRNAHFYYLSFESNRGLSAAIKAGIDFCESRYIGYIDADLQTTPEDFELLVPYIQDHELVMGIRAGRKDSFVKRMSSKIANNFRRSMTGDTAVDTGCPLKILHADVAKRLPFFTGMHRFFPALILLEGGRMKQLPVRHFPRIAGVAKYNLRNRLVAPFMDCFAYRWMRKRYIKYAIGESKI